MSKYPMEATAKIITADGESYDMGKVFLYDDNEGFRDGVTALCKQIFSGDSYIIFDGMGADVIPVDKISAIRVDRDIPTI